MTIQKLLCVLTVAETGSISKAAAKLYQTQPAISNSIRSVEHDVGFAIFERSYWGVRLTEAGKRFLPYAQEVVRNYELMQSITNSEPTRRLHIIGGGFSGISTAFYRLCHHYQASECIDLALKKGSHTDIVDSVSSGMSDLGIFLIPSTRESATTDLIKHSQLKVLMKSSISLVINLRNDHPLLQGKFELKDLWNYPFVDYTAHDFFECSELAALHIINPRKQITISNREDRYRTVAETDGFSIGCKNSQETQILYGIQTIPLNNITFTLLCIKRQSEYTKEEISTYLKYLAEELRGLK